MSKQITINTNTLNREISALRSHLQAIEQDLGNMYSAVRRLDAMWEGPANEAFRAQFESDRKSMEELCKTIRQIIECMEFAKNKYNQCETNVESIVQSIRV